MKTACMVFSRVLVFNLYERSSYFPIYTSTIMVRKKYEWDIPARSPVLPFVLIKAPLVRVASFIGGGGSQINSIFLSFKHIKTNALERIF